MSRREYTLYWSHLENFEACPQRYLWRSGWGSIDVGGGPGKRKPLPVKSSRHHAVMGQVIQKVIENMYNNEMWREPKILPQRMLEMVEKEFEIEVKRNFIEWRVAPSKSEMIEVCRSGVLGYLRTLKVNRLLGPYARAEVDLLGRIDPGNPVGGRADVMVKRDDTGVTILDGKNSQEKGKYTTPDQLRWYALCFYLVYGTLPDRLGFVYYRYPADDKGESGVDWVPVTRPDVEGLAQRAVTARSAMNAERFEATPSPSTCKFCDYETVCDARRLQKEANRAKRGAKAASDLDAVDGGGFVELKL